MHLLSRFLIPGAACLLAVACAGAPTPTERSSTTSSPGSNVTVVAASDVEWQALNPARGDSSPRAGTLWGDRAGTAATGFLVRFVDGFASPPHTHNVTYRGVVISGLVHNDDPDAADMWMPAGSFWTQPAGEAHVTAARGRRNVAYIEIDEGPYLVLPVEDAFDLGERPVNVHAANVVWVRPHGVTDAAGGPRIAYLWGTPEGRERNGTMLRLPPGFDGTVASDAGTFRAVVIAGDLTRVDGDGARALAPGSFVGASGPSVHRFRNDGDEDVIVYVRTVGAYRLAPSGG